MCRIERASHLVSIIICPRSACLGSFSLAAAPAHPLWGIRRVTEVSVSLCHIAEVSVLHILRSDSLPFAQEINRAIAELHETGDVDVISFCESIPLSLVGMLPRVLVVPEETAFPGYGETANVAADHIDACKPASREDPAYSCSRGSYSASVRRTGGGTRRLTG